MFQGPVEIFLDGDKLYHISHGKESWRVLYQDVPGSELKFSKWVVTSNIPHSKVTYS